MKRSQRIILSVALMALGVMFMILQDDFIGILMTVAGSALLILGAVDIARRLFPPAIVKMVAGLLFIICGWAIVEAVLYIVSGVLLVFGALYLYDKIKRHCRFGSVWQAILEYATPAICVTIGILLLFHNAAIVGFVCIVSGILTVLEGGILLFCAFTEE